eukprot:m.284739 g.284739  ORF g.284739 m.284739 type:complete len:721 (+) comp19425_c2_seq2:1208-3370(+)
MCTMRRSVSSAVTLLLLLCGLPSSPMCPAASSSQLNSNAGGEQPSLQELQAQREQRRAQMMRRLVSRLAGDDPVTQQASLEADLQQDPRADTAMALARLHSNERQLTKAQSVLMNFLGGVLAENAEASSVLALLNTTLGPTAGVQQRAPEDHTTFFEYEPVGADDGIVVGTPLQGLTLTLHRLWDTATLEGTAASHVAETIRTEFADKADTILEPVDGGVVAEARPPLLVSERDAAHTGGAVRRSAACGSRLFGLGAPSLLKQTMMQAVHTYLNHTAAHKDIPESNGSGTCEAGGACKAAAPEPHIVWSQAVEHSAGAYHRPFAWSTRVGCGAPKTDGGNHAGVAKGDPHAGHGCHAESVPDHDLVVVYVVDAGQSSVGANVLYLHDPRGVAASASPWPNWFAAGTTKALTLTRGAWMVFPAFVRHATMPNLDSDPRTFLWAGVRIEQGQLADTTTPPPPPPALLPPSLASFWRNWPTVVAMGQLQDNETGPATSGYVNTSVLSAAILQLRDKASLQQQQFKSNKGGWQSGVDVFEGKCSCATTSQLGSDPEHCRGADALVRLRNLAYAAIWKYLTETPAVAPLMETFGGRIGTLEIDIHAAWAGVNERGNANAIHHHPDATVSGVFYVALPPNPAPLVLRDPRTAEDHRIYPRVGSVVLFPSWLEHYVEAETSEAGRRIVVAFNARGAKALRLGKEEKKRPNSQHTYSTPVKQPTQNTL